MDNSQNIVGLIEIGASKTNVVAVSVTPENSLHFLCFAEGKTYGYKRSVITNYTEFKSGIKNVMDVANNKAGYSITNVILALTGFDYNSYILKSEITLPSDEVILKRDLDRCVQLLNFNESIDLNKEHIVHIIPLHYQLNDTKIVSHPVGMKAKKISAFYHIVTIDLEKYNDLASVFKNLNINILNIVASPYASAISTLVSDEKEVGSLVVDIGRSCISIAGFRDNNLFYNRNIPYGSHKISNLLMEKFNITSEEANRLKFKYGVRTPKDLDYSQTVQLEVIDENGNSDVKNIDLFSILSVTSSAICKIASEIKSMLGEKFLSHIKRIIITGGGAKMMGVKDVFESILNKPVRIAKPIIPAQIPADYRDEIYSVIIGTFIYFDDFIKEKTFAKFLKPRSMKFMDKIRDMWQRFVDDNFS